MKKHLSCSILVISSIIFVIVQTQVLCLPLYTNSRWIVDEGGKRVKLACVSWPSHLETMVAEGLSKQPVDDISRKIVEMGFNCVRFTWPFFMLTNDSLGSTTVLQSFQGLGLTESIAGIKLNNPCFLHLPLIQAFQVVVKNLGENKIMVILDNHISKPGWCCSNNDDNGFFGDKYFDPNVWINGLTRMATIFNGTQNVVAMSLSNELRGSKQNVNDWYKYMQQGAEAVHSVNPDLLVILSGLSYDKDFSFLTKGPVKLTFTKKLVFEVHLYAFTDGNAWQNGNPNQVCGSVMHNLMKRAGFLLDKGWPLFLSEWGVDQRGTNVNDNRYLNCIIGFAAEFDLDWAYWTDTRNSSFLQKISALQSPFQGPGLSNTRSHKIIFHPSDGLCIIRKSSSEPLKLGSCANSEAWNYTPQKILSIKGTYYCIQAVGLGKPVKLSILCTGSNSKWEAISDSKMHLSAKLSDGTTVCLDVDSSNSIITNLCTCLKTDRTCDPGSQWFKIVNSTISSSQKLGSKLRD